MSVYQEELMSEVWSKWTGHVVNGTFPLRRYLGASDHSGVFLTELAGREPPAVAIKLVRAIPTLVDSQGAQWEAAAFGLSYGQRLKHDATTSRNIGEKSGGRMMPSRRTSMPIGGLRVRASNKVIPRAHMSPAVVTLPSCSSCGSYTDTILMLAVASLTLRIVSLASFSVSPTTRMLAGLSWPCTMFLLCRNARVSRIGSSISRASPSAMARCSSSCASVWAAYSLTRYR